MKTGWLHSLAIVFLTCVGAAASLTISGNTADCVGGTRYHPAGADVYFFDATKSSELISVLKALAEEPNPNDSASVERFFAQYGHLTRLVKTSKSLAHTKSDKDGNFKISISVMPESLILLGYAESTDGPPGYAYLEVKPKRTSGPLILDFAHGNCGTR